jgi:transketolase
MPAILPKPWQNAGMRDAYGKALVKLGAENPNVVVLDADLSGSTQTKAFGKAYPDRFFNMGIAEANMTGVAAGFSVSGKIPFMSTFAVFATGRNYDQVRQSIAYPENNVKIVATHSGVSVGPDGATHQALEDMALMRGLPYMTVIAPADAVETEKAILAAAKMHGPVYVRLTRSPSPVIFGHDYDFKIGKGVFLREGKDVSIVSTGTMTVPAVEAAEILASQGISATVLHIPTVKPIDVDALIKASETGKIVTIEEHSIINGLGSAVAENLAYYNPTRQMRIGTEDKFGESGSAEELYDKYGLTAPKIAERIKIFMKH